MGTSELGSSGVDGIRTGCNQIWAIFCPLRQHLTLPFSDERVSAASDGCGVIHAPPPTDVITQQHPQKAEDNKPSEAVAAGLTLQPLDILPRDPNSPTHSRKPLGGEVTPILNLPPPPNRRLGPDKQGSNKILPPLQQPKEVCGRRNDSRSHWKRREIWKW